jgi:exonuclease III
MLYNILYSHEIDLALLQEVTDPPLFDNRTYKAFHNVGTNLRGTALVTKSEHQLDNIARTPSGRAMAANINNTRIINIYAPSGTARKTDRERFFNEELAELMYTPETDILLGGDFNCVLNPLDAVYRHEIQTYRRGIKTNTRQQKEGTKSTTHTTRRKEDTHTTPQTLGTTCTMDRNIHTPCRNP